jgi:hypothetical protein
VAARRARPLDLPVSHLQLAVCRSSDDGRWQWSYSSWEDNGLAADLEHSHHTDQGVGGRCWETSGLHALIHRLQHDAADLAAPERY